MFCQEYDDILRVYGSVNGAISVAGKVQLRFMRQQLFISSLLLPDDSFLVQKAFNLLKPAKGSYRFLKGTPQSLILAGRRFRSDLPFVDPLDRCPYYTKNRLLLNLFQET